MHRVHKKRRDRVPPVPPAAPPSFGQPLKGKNSICSSASVIMPNNPEWLEMLIGGASFLFIAASTGTVLDRLHGRQARRARRARLECDADLGIMFEFTKLASEKTDDQPGLFAAPDAAIKAIGQTPVQTYERWHEGIVSLLRSHPEAVEMEITASGRARAATSQRMERVVRRASSTSSRVRTSIFTLLDRF